MNKQELKKRLVEELNNYKIIELTEWSGNPLVEKPELYDFVNNYWSEFTELFPKLNNVKSFVSVDDLWSGDIYSSLAKLENLKVLQFYSSDLSETEKYLEEGLKKLPKLEYIWFVQSRLKKMPAIILNNRLPELKSLGIIGNKFYKQNFHFKLDKFKKCNTDLLSKIKYFINDKANQNFKKDKKKFTIDDFDRLPEFTFEENNWGLTNLSKDIIVLKDDFLNEKKNIKSLSVYVLNENKRDKYEVFKTLNDLFFEINKNTNCFETNINGDLEIFFYHEDDIIKGIELTSLIEFFKSKVDKYKGFITEDLIKELGGKSLLEEIKNSQQTNEKQIAKEFYNKNNYIESISIENFKIFEEKQRINNLDDINIVIGKNAEGKTSLLQAIAASLIPKLSDDIKNYKTLINIKAYNSESNYAKTEVIWNGKYSKRQRITDRGIVLESEKELPRSYLVLAYGENLYAKEKPVQSYQDILKTGNYKSYHTEAIFNTSFEKMVNPLDLLDELSEGQIKEANSKFKNELLKIAQSIKEKLNKFLKLSEAQHFIIKKDGAYYKFFDTKENIFVDFEQISEGYRSFIILLSDIIFRILAARNDLLVNGYFELNEIFAKVKGTIIIDEFDKHMHPSWQRTFIKTLREEFPLIQFFLSTHNMVALQSAETEKALIVNQKIIKPKIIHLGQSIEAIYNQFFEGENIFGEETIGKYKKFKERLNQINIEKVETDEELNKLRDELICNSSEMEIIIEGEIGQKRNPNGKTKQK